MQDQQVLDDNEIGHFEFGWPVIVVTLFYGMVYLVYTGSMCNVDHRPCIYIYVEV